MKAAVRQSINAALCLSAGVLGALVVVRGAAFFERAPSLAGLPFESVANAQNAGQMVASGNGYSILSTTTGGESNVVVHDARAEELVIYRTDSQGVLSLSQRIRLQQAFVEGRARFASSQ
ncbi:MAG: hypothetical protein U0573_01055 [Phycisphaerales bacterium]|nr:hypothetical protein [Planctomycetota bacterium]